MVKQEKLFLPQRPRNTYGDIFVRSIRNSSLCEERIFTCVSSSCLDIAEKNYCTSEPLRFPFFLNEICLYKYEVLEHILSGLYKSEDMHGKKFENALLHTDN
jgi:hypothetical protein